MINLEIFTGEYRDDCERIQRILRDKGYNATLQQCEELWDDYSDSMAAGWMGLGDNDEDVYSHLRHRITN